MAAPRPETLESLRFAFELLSLIPSRNYKTAQQIHDELLANGMTRDLRSVQRMLKSLAEMYPQIEQYKKKKPFGYRWRHTAPKILLPSMSQQEALLLVMSRNYLQNILPQELNEVMHSYFDEAEAVLNAKSPDRSAKDWLSKVELSPPALPLIPPPIDAEVLDTVTHCLFSNRQLRIEYRNRRGEVKEHVIQPLGLIDRAPVLYLAAISLSKEHENLSTITFALHRMLKVSEMNMTFERPKDFALKTFVQEGRHMYGSGKKLHLSFDITKEAGQHLMEAWLAEDQVIEEHDDWLRISATVNDSLELDSWLNSFGDKVRKIVRNPVEN